MNGQNGFQGNLGVQGISSGSSAIGVGGTSGCITTIGIGGYCYPPQYNHYYHPPCNCCYPHWGYWYHGNCGCHHHCGGCGCHKPAPQQVTITIEHVHKMLEPPKKKLAKKRSSNEW